MLVCQPYDGAPISDIALDDATTIQTKLTNAAECFADRSNWLSAFTRVAILKRLARLVEDESQAFALLIAREGGKPLTDAQSEVIRAICGIEIAAAEIAHLVGQEIPMGLTLASQDRLAFTTKEPIGLVVAISAFNHPLNLIVHQVIPAVATGCPVIIKPAATTPLNCIRLIELLHQAGLPEPWCQTVVVDDVRLAEILATDPRVAFLSFIGSAKIGWYLRSRLPPGTRCSLEHGGAAPVIIDKSANVDDLTEPLVKGGYYHAGQVCVSTQRIFVQEDIKETFIAQFTDRVSNLTVADPTLPNTEVGPLIMPKEVDRIDEWVQQAVAQSGVVTTGGKRINERMYQPTVIVEPDASARVCREEIFGPVTAIFGYTNLIEAITRANSLQTAFQAGVFSRDIDVALLAARLLDASTVMINDHSAFRTDWMPFSGRRQSGYGTGGIPDTMRELVLDKMLVFMM